MASRGGQVGSIVKQRERRGFCQLLQPRTAPAQPLGPSPMPRDPGTVPGLEDVAAAFHLAGPTGSKAKHISETHRDRIQTQ